MLNRVILKSLSIEFLLIKFSINRLKLDLFIWVSYLISYTVKTDESKVFEVFLILIEQSRLSFMERERERVVRLKYLIKRISFINFEY